MVGLVNIVTPPVSSQLSKLANAKADLNLSDVYVDDAFVSNLIDRASGVVSRYCGRTFGLQTVAETFRISARQSVNFQQAAAIYGTPLNSLTYSPLLVTHLPVVSITSVVENGTTLTLNTDYEYDPNAGIFWRLFNGFRAAWLMPSVAVTYVAGYVLPNDNGTRTLPYEIEEVTLSLVRGAYFARGGDPQIVREQVEGVGLNMYSLTSPLSGMELDANNQLILTPYVARAW